MLELILAFITGLAMGSFYNVLIYRIPRNVSIIFPPSSCPSCRHRIAWYDNIPVLSYLILRGRCRHCGERISPQYPIVELTSGALAVFSMWKWGFTLDAVFLYFFFSSLLVISLIDFKFFIIPDVITIPGTLVGIAVSPFREGIDFIHSASGAVVGMLIPLIIYFFYVKVRKMEGLGLGDVKLLAFIGSATGIYGVLMAFFLGSVAGLIYALPWVIKNRSAGFAIPFGPFLSLGCFIGTVIDLRGVFPLP